MRELRHRDDGAVAILVAILTVVLVGIAAFATDFGLAYANKRDLQKAADSAALAGASAVIRNLTSPTENCASIASRYAANSGGLKTTLQSIADAAALANNPRSVRVGDMTVTCSADNKRVLVGYTNDGTTPSIFGGVFDAGDLTARRTATADVFVRNDGFGLRPYAVCALDRQLLQNASAPASSPKWIKIVYPNPLCGSYGGNWYTTDCPLDGNNGTLADNTRNGCNSSVGILPQRDSAGNPLPIGTITSSIISECTAAQSGSFVPPNFCLVANPGNVAADPVVSAWDYLMTLDSIAVPVFDPSYNTIATNNVAACRAGNNGCYPVQAIASVKVCAYRWQGKTPAAVSTSPLCAGLSLSTVRDGPNQDALYLALTGPVQLSGSYGPAPGSVGDGSNVLGTRLVQ